MVCVSLSVYVCLYVSVCLFLSVSVCVCLYLCVSVCVCGYILGPIQYFSPWVAWIEVTVRSEMMSEFHGVQ